MSDETKKLLIISIVLFILGGILYYSLLWYSFGSWLFTNIILPLNELIDLNVNLNIATGILYILINFILLILLFVIPYIIVYAFILFTIIKKFKKRDNDY
jgi:hypothetical protein